MGLFSFTQDVAIDLGTANTIVSYNGKIVVDEPSVVAIDGQKKMIAVGEKAKQMHEKTNPNIQTIRPLRDGVIADFYACEMMMRGFIDKVNMGSKLFTPSLRMVIGVPYGSTEIAVISLGGIVSNGSLRTAGDDFTADIQDYMSRQHNVRVSERMAERIKIHVGSALTDLGDEAPQDYIVHGPNRITAMPIEVPVCYQEIAHCIDKSIIKIENAIISALEHTPPELYADIVHNGIYLAGGGALLRGLDKRLSNKINIPFHIAENPLYCVAKGTALALNDLSYPFLMR